MFFKRKIETDEEFIAKIRKRCKTFRKMAVIQFIISVVLAVISLFFLFVIFSGTQPGSFKGKTLYIGFSLGVIAGAFFAFAIEMAISNFIDAVSNFKGKKEYNLLIKYYDQINPSEENKK
ncbi:MAG: hypothetical protein A2Y12_02775 [Planctomycetes bacterium GWF2_42_9]|nr:MAG: hypothetical protein A2Y12_02775 [Planctomycetes bacterium GWF2_42_9]HAL45824.1 hypothetical protein [Phycisphaerales bacterium]